jgi:hypothetical protein
MTNQGSNFTCRQGVNFRLPLTKRSAELVWGARRPRLNPTDSPTDYSSTSISASAGPNRLAASIA